MDNMNEDTTTNEDRAAAIGNWIMEVALDMRDKAISTLEEFADTVQDNPRYLRDILEDNPLYLGLLVVLFLMGFGLSVIFLVGIGIFFTFFFLLVIAAFVISVLFVFFIYTLQHKRNDEEVQDSINNSDNDQADDQSDG